MGVDWDKHLLGPLHNVFAEKARWEPVKSAKGAEFYDIDGILTGPISRTTKALTVKAVSIPPVPSSVCAMLFLPCRRRKDRVFLYSVSTLFVVSDVQPDSHGGTHLILNKVK